MIKIVLFLTGTIAPENVPNLERKNIEERENDYYEAIKSWLVLGINLVFCENSGYHSEKLGQLFAHYPHCEYLKFKTQKSFYGKGHGEAEIFEFVFQNSKLFQQSNLSIIKVTGRFFVLNINKILNGIGNNQHIDLYGQFTDNLTWMDSRFFIFKVPFYENYLSTALKDIDEKNRVFFEHCLAKAALRYIADNHKWTLLPEVPRIQGFNGTNNDKYNTSMFRAIRSALFQKIRKFAYAR